MNRGKIISGFVALVIYLSLIFMLLFFYNIHQSNAKNYVEKNSDRVTVTLVNSDKTVFNKSEKKSIPNKPLPIIAPLIKNHIVKKHSIKKTKRAIKAIPKPRKVVSRKKIPRKTKKKVPVKKVPKKKVPVKKVPKKKVPVKKVPKKKVPVKKVPKKKVPVKKVPKKKVPVKKVPKKKVPVKKVPKKKVPVKKVPKKKVPKKTAQDLFSSIHTNRPVKRTPKHTQPVMPPRPIKRPSSIRHTSSITNRIEATHQSGRVSNANRNRGVESAYIARVKRHMDNWNPMGMKGQWVTVHLTIYNSGKFRYTTSGVNGSMRASLKHYLDTLNRMGLGGHKKSTPYSIQVRFKVR